MPFASTPETNALTPEGFEMALESLLADAEAEAPSELRQAYQRLRDNPSLLRGNAKGGFTYSDPVLAQALYSLRMSFSAKPTKLLARPRPGSDLHGDMKSWGRWMMVGVRAFAHRHDESLKSLAARIPAASISFDKPVLRLAVTGDAGYRGVAQSRVLDMILKRHREAAFDGAVHLGDVYFAAGKGEMLEHFLAPFSALGNEGLRVLTLPGNHDLYFGGQAFEAALDVLNQPGRFFLVETPHWKIPCLDTSLFDPTVGRKEGLLDESQLHWLKKILQKDQRGAVIMSHHFFLSAWAKGGDPLRYQLRDLFKDSAFAWYWGHEHSCATYDRGDHGFYGACVGNGSFIEAWSKPALASNGFPSWYATGKCTCYSEKGHYWPHGFLELELRPTELRETYHFENGPPYTRTLPR